MTQLQHVGVLGMKWGIRRSRGPASSDHTVTRAIKKKHISEMSNDELKKLTTRLQLEKQYKDLTGQNNNVAKKFIAEIGTNFLKQKAAELLGTAANNAGKLLMEYIEKKRG